MVVGLFGPREFTPSLSLSHILREFLLFTAEYRTRACDELAWNSSECMVATSLRFHDYQVHLFALGMLLIVEPTSS